MMKTKMTGTATSKVSRKIVVETNLGARWDRDYKFIPYFLAAYFYI